jgi:SAM-dependent methyltransferase
MPASKPDLDRQYRSDVNLAARQSIYAYQRPYRELTGLVLDVAALDGTETVADIGCGNGRYLAGLARRGHGGRLLGVDRSPGMLRAAGEQAPTARLLAGDAAALPLSEHSCDIILVMHMLYYLPHPDAVLREFRRVARRGGRVLIGLNGPGHLQEMRDLMAAALRETGQPGPSGPDAGLARGWLHLDRGQELAAHVFGTVARHDFTAELVLSDPEPVEAYVRSTMTAQSVAEPEALVAAVRRRIPFGPDGTFRVTTHAGCLVCS